MRRHWGRRRRLIWAGVLLGVVVIVAVLSVVDAALRAYDRLVAATRDQRPMWIASALFPHPGLAPWRLPGVTEETGDRRHVAP